MYKKFDKNRIGADKITLLGLFVLGLILAYAVTIWRSAVRFSEPIELSYTGLSVSMPAGNGWQSEKKWQYHKNRFTLSSVFTPGSAQPAALIQCQYLLAAPVDSVQAQLEQKASEFRGEIITTGQTRTDQLTADWVHIKKQTSTDSFFAIIELPYKRQLNIEFHQAINDPERGQKLLEQTIKSLKLKESPPLTAGIEIISDIKTFGLDSFLDNKNQQSFYLIKNAQKQLIGFTMSVIVASGSPEQPDIQAVSLLYIRRQPGYEQTTFFQGRSDLGKFTWNTEAVSAAGSRGSNIRLDSSGELSITRSNAPNRTLIQRLNPAIVPDIFLEVLLYKFLDSNHRQIVLELIEADGKIIPTLITKQQPPDSAAGQDMDDSILTIALLDGRGFSEQVYVHRGQITKKLLKQENVYLLELTDAETLAGLFPGHADFILQKNDLLKQKPLLY